MSGHGLRFARFEFELTCRGATVDDLVRTRYPGFLDARRADGAEATDGSADVAIGGVPLAIDLETSLDLPGTDPTAFRVHQTGGETFEIESGALFATVDLERAHARATIIDPEHPAAAPALPGMALENFLRLLTAVVAPRHGAALVHSAAVSLTEGRRAVLLHGPSGRGKSTSSRLSTERDPRHRVLSDDLCVIDVDEWGGARVHSTPFWGDDPPGPRPRAPHAIAACCELVQAQEHRADPMATGEAVGALLAAVPFQGFLPRSSVDAILDVVMQVTSAVPSFTLRFRKDPAFWSAIEGVLPSPPG